MGLYRGLGGLLEVELTSANMEMTFDAIFHEGIGLFSVHSKDELTSSFVIKRSELSRLQALTKKRGERIAICGERGLYWKLKGFLKRPVLLIISFVIFLLTIYLPTKVMFLRVDGNITVPRKIILEAAKESGICFWADRKDVRSERVKNRLLVLVPEIEWAGVNSRGCVVYISVRERSIGEESSTTGPGSIFAARDGIISSITVSKGTAHASVGEAVIEGQLLISGYTDCGNILLSEKAEGEVYAYTSRELSVVTPQNCGFKAAAGRSEHRYSIIIGKKRINLWKGSGICPSTCDRMYQEYWLTLPGGYSLPVCFVRETLTHHNLSEGTADDAGESLSAYAQTYLLDHMVAGNILRQDTSCSDSEGIWFFEGRYGCLEMIGQLKREEIGEALWLK